MAAVLRICGTWLCAEEGQDRRVDTYTHGHADPVLQSHRWRTAENSAAYLLPALRPGLDLLDVGCGPGTITVDLAARVAPGPGARHRRLAGPAGRGRGAAERAGVAVTFEVGDVYALAAADDSFDVVHAHQVLQHLTDPVAALREMARVCRPGGVIAVRDVDYGAFVTVPRGRRARPLAGPLPPGGQAQRRGAGRRAPAAGVGARGGPARRHRDDVVLVLRHGGRAGVVGQLVGRAGDGVVLRRAGRGLRAGVAGATWRRSPPPGCAGATRTTAGSACCTANCSSASEPPTCALKWQFGARELPHQRTDRPHQPWRAALAWTAVLTYCARPGAICS